jgi:hypothetical protein
MKRMIVFVCAMSLLFSCSKKSSSAPSDPTGKNSVTVPVVGPDLSSVILTLNGLYIKDSFEYDTSHNIARLLQYDFDSTVLGGPVADSEIVAFVITGNNLPSAYNFTRDLITTTHQLFYNNQNQVIKDTCSTSGYVAYYTYPAGSISADVLFNGTTADSRVDQLYINNSNNEDSTKVYLSGSDGVADSLVTSEVYTFSSYTNPAYYPAISNVAGPLLYVLTQDYIGGGYGSVTIPVTDFISKMSKATTAHYGGALLATVSLATTLDSKGRVSLITYPSDNLEKIRYTYYP